MSTPMVFAPTPLIPTPTPLEPTMETVTDLDPSMFPSNPLVADEFPVTVVVAIQLPVTVEGLEAVQPVASPLPSSRPPLVLSPNPLCTSMVAMADSDPSIATVNPLMADSVMQGSDHTPMSFIVAIQPSGAVQSSKTIKFFQAIQPISTPLVVAPTPLNTTSPLPVVTAPTPTMVTVVTMTDANPFVTSGNPNMAHNHLDTLTGKTPLTMVIAVQSPVAI